LGDPRAATVTIYRLLVAQWGWGRKRVLAALGDAGGLLWPGGKAVFPENKLVGALTGRERAALVAACEPKREVA